jgi:hypothetical protein
VPELRRANDKRVVVDVAGVIGPQTYYLVPLGHGAISIIRSFLVKPALWRSSYTLGNVNHWQYEIPSWETFDEIRAIVDEAISDLQVECLMPCLELNSSLQDINTSVGGLEASLETQFGLVVAKLEEIRTAMVSQDLSDELDDVEEILDGIGTILGATAILVP